MLTVAELAAAMDARFEGDGGLSLSGAAEPAAAAPDQIALAMSAAFVADLAKGSAAAAVLEAGTDWEALGLKAAIFTPRPRYALSGVTTAFAHDPDIAPGIHPGAIVDPSAEIGADAAIGPLVVVGPNARIGDRARIRPHCTIGAGARIGADALLHDGVKIGARVEIGARFIAQPGAVIGADGFSFVTPTPGMVEEARATGAVAAREQAAYIRIHSLGAVRIGDDVEVGANACIDRGTIADTTIGDGTKIDNLVQIGHNVRIGQTCLICGQAGIAGSTVIGDRVVLGGKASVADHLRIGSNVIITGNSGVASHVPANRVMMGYPAVRMDQNVEMYKALRRLPRILDRLRAGQK